MAIAMSVSIQSTNMQTIAFHDVSDHAGRFRNCRAYHHSPSQNPYRLDIRHDKHHTTTATTPLYLALRRIEPLSPKNETSIRGMTSH